VRDQPGGVDEVIKELGRLARKMGDQRCKARRKRLRRELTYVQNQRDRMDDAAYQSRGLPMGSGLAEAACKTLATQRLKRSGMSWRDGKQAMLLDFPALWWLKRHSQEPARVWARSLRGVFSKDWICSSPRRACASDNA
jgi:hypothetical protein